MMAVWGLFVLAAAGSLTRGLSNADLGTAAPADRATAGHPPAERGAAGPEQEQEASRGVAEVGPNASAAEAADPAAAPERRLPPSLPTVVDVDFQDFDLARGDVFGTVTWTPPADTTSISGYDVYLTDSSGELATGIHWGTLPLGTDQLEVAENTSLAGLTRIYVYTRSLLGMNPDGVYVEICDVAEEDTLSITNAVATAAPWGVVELSFYASPRCADPPLRWAEIRATSNDATVQRAADGDEFSAWASSCSSCGARSERLQVVGVCKPDEVRCVKVFQCKGDGTFGCPAGVSRSDGLTTLLRGEEVHTWSPLPGFFTLRHEHLVVPGRRRRASFALFSVAPSRPEQTTYCLSNAPSMAC